MAKQLLGICDHGFLVLHWCNSKIKQLQHIHKPHVTFHMGKLYQAECGKNLNGKNSVPGVRRCKQRVGKCTHRRRPTYADTQSGLLIE